MALATQCPHCYTSFRVANDQLKLHAGMVRCGACKQTFNGIEHLLAPGAAAKTPPSANPTSNATQASVEKNAANISASDIIAAMENTHLPPASSSQGEATPEISQEHANLDSSLHPDSELGLEKTDHIDLEAKEEAGSTTITSGLETQTKGENLTTDTEVGTALNSEIDSDVDREVSPKLDTEASPQLNTEFSAEPESIIKDQAPSAVQPHTELAAHHEDDLTLEETEQAHDATKLTSENSTQDSSNSDVDHLTATASKATSTAVASPQLSDLDKALNLPPSASESSATELEPKPALESSLDSSVESTLESTLEATLTSEPEPKAELTPAVKQNTRKPTSLTANLDFELSKEDREWVDELAHIHQLELETRAAVLDEATDDWSKHETTSAQDGFIDSLKDLKPILDDITAQNTSTDLPTTTVKHQTLNDLRVSSGREKLADSLADQQDSFNETMVHDPEVTPAFVLQAERAQRFGKWKRYGLGLGVVLFTLLGVAQSAYFLRSDIAAQMPQLKPQLLSICKALSCQIKLPAQKSLLEITGSELLIVNEELSMNTLSVQIQNKSGTVQAWPHFDLTLKDRRGKDLLQKAFSPSQYLDNKDLLNKGMAANSETNHKIFFQLNGLKASDYTVEIFYP
ncbi:DUF3426 domain-containing protein [Undibacterium danionis]|uniref:DUF3426 domain-containing protein n=1 Tax=Undibacterium danionis TaxID=1812100 RepID=A0ABV6ID84_9BURK